MLRVCTVPGCGTFTLGELCAGHEPVPVRTVWPRGRPLRRETGQLDLAHVEAERLRQALTALGGAAVLTDQESAVLATLLAGLTLLPWLLRRRPPAPGPVTRWPVTWWPVTLRPGALRPVVLMAAVAIVVASPQVIAMIVQSAGGGTAIPELVGELRRRWLGWQRARAARAAAAAPAARR